MDTQIQVKFLAKFSTKLQIDHIGVRSIAILING